MESYSAEVNLFTPLLDRYSPIAYSDAKFIHEETALHSGYESCYRHCLSYCHILQGNSLFKEIGDDCSFCKMVRKKFIDVSMGPVSDHQLTIAKPFYAAYVDLDGPYKSYVNQKETRNTRPPEPNMWILSFADPVTKLINLQVVESKSAEGVVSGLIRLGCEHGFPKILLLDQERSFVKTVADAEVFLKDLNLRCYKEYGIECKFSPVAGHNFTGLVERKIRSDRKFSRRSG